MKLLPLAATLLLFAPSSFAGTTPARPPANPQGAEQSEDSGSWVDQISGKKFFAVDGSSVMLSPNDSGFALDTVAPDGTVHDTSFNMLGDNLGSITEGDDSKHVTGVFRLAGNAIEANFSDGRTETLAINAAGGITLLLNAPGAQSWCMKWFPQGHSFGDADKKQALAQYASKLGLVPPPKDRAVTHASCIEAAASGHMPPVAAILPPQHGLAEPISVRTSQVHPIDAPVAPASAQAISPPVPPAASPVKAADLTADHPLIQNHGASSCLKIDNDGSSWGFRNSCGYGVQYAWCLEKGSDARTACGSGTGSGSLASNAFAALMPGSAAVDADNQFRWVACNGGSEVSAQLDRSDPPAGRCVITGDQ